jgi:hypothetical protein
MHATNTDNPIDFPVTQKQRNKELAQSLLSQVEELVDEFVRDNLDMDLDMEDLVEQHEYITRYIKKEMFK